MYCPKCGSYAHHDANFCTRCGLRFDAQSRPVAVRDARGQVQAVHHGQQQIQHRPSNQQVAHRPSNQPAVQHHHHHQQQPKYVAYSEATSYTQPQPHYRVEHHEHHQHVQQVNVYAGGYGGPTKSKSVTLLLAIFFGILGIHRFYVGKIGTGLLWLFTGGFFGIGWVVDIIIIALDGFRDVNGRFLA